MTTKTKAVLVAAALLLFAGCKATGDVTGSDSSSSSADEYGTGTYDGTSGVDTDTGTGAMMDDNDRMMSGSTLNHGDEDDTGVNVHASGSVDLNQ